MSSHASPRAVTGFVARAVSNAGARHIFLSTAGAVPGLVRFLSTEVRLPDGARTSWVTVTRTGTFSDPRYGAFDITPAMLAQMVANFDRRVLGQDVFFDVAHRPDDGSAFRVLKLVVDGTRLRALAEWTDFGIEAVKKRGFRYLSAEYHEAWCDNEQGQAHGCVLLGGGLTNRPVVKRLEPVTLSEGAAGADDDDEAKTAIHPNLARSLATELNIMNKQLADLRVKLLAQGLTEDQIKPLLAAAKAQMEADQADDAKCLAIAGTFEAAGVQLAAEIKRLSAAGGGGGAAPVINLQVAAPAGESVEAAVTRLLAQRATAEAADAATLAAKVKLLSDTVTAATTLDDTGKAALVAELQPLVTRTLSDDQVRGLASFALSQAGRVSAAVQLATMGYRPLSGSVHITVDSGNQLKALQQQVDRRLGFEGLADSQRYMRTGGVLLAANKLFAEKALAQFDALHGHKLVAEHKLLAAGTGSLSDVSVPASFERTVLRESLYQMVGLNFVDVGTMDFAAVLQIPYSYRDTTAAGNTALQVYEGQGIPRGGIKQDYEEARPIPQKIAFKLSNEMRYLLAGAPIDFEPLAENTRNLIRIVSEDTDRLVQNEIVRANDEAYTSTVTDTLTASVNGTNKIFVLSQWPVVRPRKVYDLKGAQVGSTLYGITVTLNAVARSEYVTGVTLAAGLYWVMDYNLGEIRFVNEAGALQLPTNGWALTVAYTYTTNAAKFNLDVGSSPDTINDVYDRLLTLLGGRKVVVENDRYYTANMMLMSGAVDNAIGQAKTFTANSSRPGTGLAPDGSIATIKGMPAFNTRAPGLYTGDLRVMVGQIRNTRFRMLKPWSMNNLEQARDSNGLFTGQTENYGDQFVACMTPTPLKNATSSVVLYSATARVARAA